MTSDRPTAKAMSRTMPKHKTRSKGADAELIRKSSSIPQTFRQGKLKCGTDVQ